MQLVIMYTNMKFWKLSHLPNYICTYAHSTYYSYDKCNTSSYLGCELKNRD